jgi:PAS domain-containing protein
MRSALIKFLLALILGLALLYVLDRLEVSALSFPVCLSIVIMGISLRQKPALVLAISFSYVVLVAFSALYFLYHSNPYHVPFPIRLFGLVQREGVFIVVCAMAVYMSFYRVASEQQLADLEKTFSKVPVPVVISNGAGYITYANESIKETFKYLPQDLIGKRYTDFFMPGIAEGKAMRFYIELFAESNDTPKEIDLVPFGESIPLCARIICHGDGYKRSLITVLQPQDSTLRPVLHER